MSILASILAAAVVAQEGADRAAAAIREAGGSVRGHADDDPGWEVAFHLSAREVGDEVLVSLAGLGNVVDLNLRGTRITDAGLARLKPLTSLRRLHLERTSVGDAGLAHLSGLVRLEYLNLYGTKVTDRGLAALHGMKKLRRLYVWQTGVTEAGAARLREALPNVRISMGVDLSTLPVYVEPEKEVLKPKADLKWIATSDRSKAPKSFGGENTQVLFENRSGRKVKLVWIGYDNMLRLYAELERGASRPQNTYTNNSWLITDEDDRPLGFFVVDTPEVARAVIPAGKE